MATEVISIVDPDNGAGTDYTSLSAWEAGEQRDLTTADEIAVAKCRSTAGSADTSVVTISGWTTSSTQYIKIWTDPSESYRHDGKWNSSKYRLTPSSGTILGDHEDYVVIEGLQFGWTALSSDSAAISIDYLSATNNLCTVRQCVFDGSSSSYTYGIYTGNANTKLLAQDNILYGFKREWFGAIRLVCDEADIYNCTIYDSYYGVRQSGGTITVKNCAILGCTDDFNGTLTIDYCASDDGDGTNPVSPSGSDWANEFTDYTNGDFSILNTGNLYLGSEITQADDSNVPSTDIIGSARNTGAGEQTSIGAFEYASAGTTRDLVASVIGQSATPNIAATILRSIVAGIQGASVTPDITANLNQIIDLIASISGSSATPDIQVFLIRSISAAITNASLTPDAQAVIARALVAMLSGDSATPDIQATIARSLMAGIAGQSVTPDIQSVLIRSISANIQGQSSTPAVPVQIMRHLVASVIGSSITPDITATIEGIINLVASISGQSVTPDIAAVSDRVLSANIAGQSTTSQVAVNMSRSLLAGVSGQSVTPDITVVLANIINLSASIQGISIAPDIAATIARSLTAVITGQGQTPAITVTTARQLVAAIQGAGITPDDLILILAGLGVILDPTIECLTVQRTIDSVTVQRTIESI